MTRVTAALALLAVAAYGPASPAEQINFASRPARSSVALRLVLRVRRRRSRPAFVSRRRLDQGPAAAVRRPALRGPGLPLPDLGAGREPRRGPRGTARRRTAARPGRTASSSDRLRGWGDIGAGADLRLFGRLRVVGPVAVLAGVRRQLGAGNGTVVDAGLTGTLPLMRRLIVSATGTVSWANARYTRSYFGVDADQSAAALLFGSAVPTFAAGAGLRDASLALNAIVRVDQHWSVQSVARTEVLLGDAARSPLTERRIQLTFGGFIAYRL